MVNQNNSKVIHSGPPFGAFWAEGRTKEWLRKTQKTRFEKGFNKVSAKSKNNRAPAAEQGVFYPENDTGI